jgi:hypothetical protein
MLPKDRESFITAVSSWETPVSLYQMKDERIRFEVREEPIEKY